MDHNSIIDRETFEVYEHAEDYPKAFICDKRIAPSIALLNKKGYKTLASCSGHYRMEWATQKIVMSYILFDKKYKFDSIPKDFTEEESDGRTLIFINVDLYKDDKLKKRPEFERELDNICQNLNEWVNNIPYNKERNDD